MDVEGCREQAAEAERLLDRDGEMAARLADELLDGKVAIDDEVASVAHRVLAVTALRRGDTQAALAAIEKSVAAAERSQVSVVLGKALMTAMAVAASSGDPEGALELADRADPLLPDDLRLRLAIQRGSVLVAGLSAVDEAIAVFDRVLDEYPEIPPFEHGILRLNRGTQLLRRGELVAASGDFERARLEFCAAGSRQYETASMLHLAIAAARMGDLPAVFAIHHDVSETDALSHSDPHDLLDLAQCLLISGLLAEANELIEHAVELGRATAVSEFSIQVELLAARVQRLLGAPGAVAAWERARRSAERFGRDEALALATVEGAAVHRADPANGPQIDALRVAADVLGRAGHRREAVEAEIELLVRMLDDDSVPVETSPGARPVGNDLTPFERAQIRHQRALQYCLDGRSAQARRELISGIRDIEVARASIAAADVRAAAGDRAPEMAALGLRLAIEAGRPRPVLEWAERVRATALRLADASHRRDDVLADALDELRQVDTRDHAGTTALEHTITRRVRTGRTAGPVVRPSTAEEICCAVGPDRVLLEYLEVDGRLRLCAVSGQRVHLVDLGITVREVGEWVGKILFGLRRMSSRTGSSADAAAATVVQLADRLATLILPDRWLAADELVIVPTGPLHHAPWAALTSLASKPFVVAPSAHIWRSVERQPRRGDGVVVATGPGLPEAEHESRAVSGAWGTPVRELVGASAGDLRAHLPGAEVAHLCCHGRFRTDSPQFSALEMADGPFTVFDLEGLDELPSLVVLSACSLGSVDVRLGDDLLGFPAALFARGVSTLIASVLPVEDTATRAFMLELHAGLAAGRPPATAARDARIVVHDLVPRHAAAAAAASFLCFGKG